MSSSLLVQKEQRNSASKTLFPIRQGSSDSDNHYTHCVSQEATENEQSFQKTNLKERFGGASGELQKGKCKI